MNIDRYKSIKKKVVTSINKNVDDFAIEIDDFLSIVIDFVNRQ